MTVSCQQATSQHSAGMSEVMNEVAMRLTDVQFQPSISLGTVCSMLRKRLGLFHRFFWDRRRCLKGKVVDGHFYVGHQGKFVEVSEAVYTYARWHGISLFLTLPLIGLIGYRLKTAKREDDLSKPSARSG
jgi:hypothetical protein